MADAGIDLSNPGNALLPFINGKTTTTSGVLATNEGRLCFLQSGGKSIYDLPAAIHAEGKAAIVIRETGSSGGVVYHNNPSGTCNMCNSNISTLLPEGTQMRVVPPHGTVRPSSRWFVKPEPYVGNAKIPGLKVQ